MKKLIEKSLSILTAVLMLFCILPLGIFAEGDIPIDEAHSPDLSINQHKAV